MMENQELIKQELKEAYQRLQIKKNHFNFLSGEMTDCIIYEILAEEARIKYLLSLLKAKNTDLQNSPSSA